MKKKSFAFSLTGKIIVCQLIYEKSKLYFAGG